MTETTEAAPAPKVLAPAEERGRLTIAAAVVGGIIEAAAGEVDGVVSDARHSAGRASRAARATTRLDGTAAAVRVRVALQYPRPLPEILGRLRAHILERVDQLAGVTVQTCDIDVTSLVPQPYDGKVD